MSAILSTWCECAFWEQQLFLSLDLLVPFILVSPPTAALRDPLVPIPRVLSRSQPTVCSKYGSKYADTRSCQKKQQRTVTTNPNVRNIKIVDWIFENHLATFDYSIEIQCQSFIVSLYILHKKRILHNVYGVRVCNFISLKFLFFFTLYYIRFECTIIWIEINFFNFYNFLYLDGNWLESYANLISTLMVTRKILASIV